MASFAGRFSETHNKGFTVLALNINLIGRFGKLASTGAILLAVKKYIFTLHAIITHFVHADNGKFYACFVDFKKAFDKVSHALLWHKLMQFGPGGKFLALVRAMYA